jgi:hypothetical protein
MSRIQWDTNFPDVFVHAKWQSYDKKQDTLKSHPLYQAAKGQRDVQSAIDIVDDLANERTTYGLFEFAEAKGRPKLIAPATQPGDSSNALAIGYAEWLANEYDWPVEDRVFHKKAISRDFSGAWPRIANRCEFYGEIDRNADYVIVDDVVTMGGTLADLRSFILGKGGRVIAMSAIASNSGGDQTIRLGNDTRASIERLYGQDRKRVGELLGYDPACLTEAEGAKVAGCYGYVDLRKRVSRARNS